MRPPRSRLQAHVDEWTPKLGWLAKYVYHHTDVRNAASILNSGWLFSRNEVRARGIDVVDAASAQVIANTAPAHQDFVRLYFHPKTPTQYNCEGIRPVSSLTDLKAHCPVPIFFLFGLVDLLSQEGVCFSNGNMASAHVDWDDTETFFDSIPFKYVYHRGGLSGFNDPRAVVFHRHAEVLVPKWLSTSAVKGIRCRSHAERLTLLNYLEPNRRAHFEQYIKVTGAEFYNRKWAFVDNVTVTPTTVHIQINPPDWCTEKIPVFVNYKGPQAGWVWKFENIDTALVLNMRNLASQGLLTVKIADQIAFRDEITLSDAPY